MAGKGNRVNGWRRAMLQTNLANEILKTTNDTNRKDAWASIVNETGIASLHPIVSMPPDTAEWGCVSSPLASIHRTQGTQPDRDTLVVPYPTHLTQAMLDNKEARDPNTGVPLLLASMFNAVMPYTITLKNMAKTMDANVRDGIRAHFPNIPADFVRFYRTNNAMEPTGGIIYAARSWRPSLSMLLTTPFIVWGTAHNFCQRRGGDLCAGYGEGSWGAMSYSKDAWVVKVGAEGYWIQSNPRRVQNALISLQANPDLLPPRVRNLVVQYTTWNDRRDWTVNDRPETEEDVKARALVIRVLTTWATPEALLATYRRRILNGPLMENGRTILIWVLAVVGATPVTIVPGFKRQEQGTIDLFPVHYLRIGPRASHATPTNVNIQTWDRNDVAFDNNALYAANMHPSYNRRHGITRPTFRT